MIRHVDYLQNDWQNEKQLLVGRITLRDGPAASVPALFVEGYASGERGSQTVQILFTHMAHLREELYTEGLEEPDYAKRCELLACTLPFLLERMGARYDGGYFLCSSLHNENDCSFKDRRELAMKRVPYTEGAFRLGAPKGESDG